MKRILFGLLALTLAAAQLPGQSPGELSTWRRGPAGFEADPGCTDAPVAVGSLHKPFVAKAWAQAHPLDPSPRFLCEGRDGCWLRAGHGELGLTEALSRSCNAYFRQLAAATPRAALAAALEDAGFILTGELTPDAAIGLGDPAVLTIPPSRLLEAYRGLTRTPWPCGEAIRQEVLAGLRQSALTGTAAALGQRGYWAKTGTVPAPGDPLHTHGLVLAVDDSGWAVLALRSPGTGAEAAASLAGPLRRLRPWNAGTPPRPGQARVRVASSIPGARVSEPVEAGRVSVRLLDLLRPEALFVRNAGSAPVALGRGFLGAGARTELRAGDRIGPGLLEVEAPGHGLLRRVEGTLVCGPGLRLTAILTRREYVGGILEGELPHASPLRMPLGAAVLRFLAQPPRHRDAQVCDSTHCAWFLGRGPRLDWTDPGHARAVTAAIGPWGLTDAEWAAVQEAARTPGPSLWTSHCGGRPLAPHALWGQGDTAAGPCPRHGPGQTRPWVRVWSAQALAGAFGGPVTNVEAGQDRGVWVLRVAGPRGVRAFTYDDAHRRLAKVLGWGALPSPADAVEPEAGGWRVRGVGLGHRVGLCLGD